LEAEQRVRREFNPSAEEMTKEIEALKEKFNDMLRQKGNRPENRVVPWDDFDERIQPPRGTG
jgi:hypothetical protein